MLDRAQISWSRLRRSFSRSRLAARLLGHRDRPTRAREPGHVIIQVDGLAPHRLRRAVREGTMPFVGGLLARHGYRMTTLYSGQPSSTPAVQAELLYGRRGAVPAFAFRTADGRVCAMNQPGAAAEVEEKLAAEERGLLRGGVSWSNILGGGARHAYVCASRTSLREALASIAPRRWWGLVTLYVTSVLRVIGHSAWLWFRLIRDIESRRVRGRRLLTEFQHLPVRVLVDTALQEIITRGTCHAIEQGVPSVHVNFLGYDEHAHRVGPDGRLAMAALRPIDRAIRRIWKATETAKHREYYVWIFADHGQESVTTYDSVAGMSLGEAVEKAYADEVELTGHEDLTDETPTTVHQSPTGIVYLPEGTPASWRRRIAVRLVRDHHVPSVLLRREEDGEVVAVSQYGSGPLTAERIALGAGHPAPDDVLDDLRHLVHHELAGDLLVLGWSPASPLTFQEERGSHGGPGPRECSGFALLPPDVAVGRSPSVIRPRELREIIRSTGRRSLRTRTVAPRLHRPGLRVMTYNVHGCRGMDGRVAPERVARAIASVDADVILLQEVDYDRARSDHRDQLADIAGRLGYASISHAVRNEAGDRFGNGILSRVPVTLAHVDRLPRRAERGPLGRTEPRGAMWATVRLQGRTVVLVNTHLSVIGVERRIQLSALARLLHRLRARRDHPLVLAGDFNTGPTAKALLPIHEVLRPVHDELGRPLETWSNRAPLRAIDHVFVSAEIAVRRAFVVRNAITRTASDHLPLVTDLELRTGVRRAGSRAARTGRTERSVIGA